MPFCQGTMHNVGYSLAAMVQDLCRHLTCDLNPLELLKSEMLPEIHTMEKCDYLKSIIHSQILKFSVRIDSSGIVSIHQTKACETEN